MKLDLPAVNINIYYKWDVAIVGLARTENHQVAKETEDVAVADVTG
jgi:hypothetical protein